LNCLDLSGTARIGITVWEGLMMASKKKHTKGKTAPAKLASSKATGKKKVVASKTKPKSKSQPVVAVVVSAAPIPTTAPPIVISYDLVAKRAFEIWQRKLHTNYPEHNWREAEEQIRAELSGTKK
jgi:hypothetical protein